MAGLACSQFCTYDVSSCTGGRCGDGMINGAELCDGAPLFAVGLSEIQQFDGIAWPPVRPPAAADFLDVWATPTVVHVLGDDGVVYRILRTRPWVCRAHETACADAVDDDCDGLMDELDVDDCP